jgi:hypothetical protein
MVFLIDAVDAVNEVVVYESLEDITSRIEWQDVAEGGSTILDEQGRTYGWDNSKVGEYGTTYGYTLMMRDVDYSLRDQCIREYEALGKPAEFTL